MPESIPYDDALNQFHELAYQEAVRGIGKRIGRSSTHTIRSRWRPARSAPPSAWVLGGIAIKAAGLVAVLEDITGKPVDDRNAKERARHFVASAFLKAANGAEEAEIANLIESQRKYPRIWAALSRKRYWGSVTVCTRRSTIRPNPPFRNAFGAN